MTIDQFYRVVRAVAEITGKQEIIVIGSQAILGWHPELQDELLSASNDLDVEPRGATEDERNEIRGILGEMSPFNESCGAYADAVDVNEVAQLPSGWEERLLRVRVASLITNSGHQAVALCLHPNDIIVSKLIAGREGKDDTYCRAMILQDFPEVEQSRILQGLNEIRQRRSEKQRQVKVAEALVRSSFAELEQRKQAVHRSRRG